MGCKTNTLNNHKQSKAIYMLKKYDKNGTEVNLLQNTDIESGEGYTKSPDGTLIQWGEVVAAPGVNYGEFTFPIPFKAGTKRIVTATHQWNNDSQGYVTIASGSEKYINIVITDYSAKFTNTRIASVIAIGRWK